MNWIPENLCNVISEFIGGVIEGFGELINNIFFWIVDTAVQNSYVQNAQKMLVALSFALISLAVVKIVSSGYLTETDYDSDADPFNLIIRIAETTAVISCSGWIFDFTLQLSKDFASDLIKSTQVSGFADQTQALMDASPISAIGNIAFPYYLFLIVILVALVIFTVISGLRGGELIVMKLFMPLFALDMLTPSRERWNNYFMGYMLAFFSYGVQVLFFTIALKSYASASYTSPEYMVSALVWIIVAIRAPKFLERYLYKSGVSSAASSGLRMVIQTAAIKAV